MNQEPRRSGSGGRPRRNVLATPAGAGALAVLVIALAAAIAILPSLGSGTSSAPLATCGAPPAPTTCAPSTATPEPAATESPLPSFIRPTPTPGPTFTSYVVQAGDSLTSIARAFRTSPRSLAWWNRGTYPSLDPESEGYDPNHIEPGWTLVAIPGVTVDDLAAPTASPGPPTLAPTASPDVAPTTSPDVPTAVPSTGG